MDDNESPPRPPSNFRAARQINNPQNAAQRQHQHSLAHTIPSHLPVQQWQLQDLQDELQILRQQYSLQQQQTALNQRRTAAAQRDRETLQQENNALLQERDTLKNEVTTLKRQLAALQTETDTVTASCRLSLDSTSQPASQLPRGKSKHQRVSDNLSPSGNPHTAYSPSRALPSVTPRAELPSVSATFMRQPLNIKSERRTTDIAFDDENDTIPVIGSDGYAQIHSTLSGEDGAVDVFSTASLTQQGDDRAVSNHRPVRVRHKPRTMLDHGSIDSAAPAKRRKLGPADTIPPKFNIFVFVPDLSHEGSLKALQELPQSLSIHFGSYLHDLFNNAKHKTQACRKLAPGNLSNVVKSGICVTKHVKWKMGDLGSTPLTEEACDRCCNTTPPSPCAKLVEREGTHVLVIYPWPEQRRPPGVLWTNAQFWLGPESPI